METALADLVLSSPQPTREQLRDALLTRGVPADTLEISASTTPTGLEADAIQVGVLSGTVCLMAYVRDGTVSSATLPVLASGQCFLGSDHG
ncbi:DUF6993 domain-containing protein [Arthrobacter sp. H41]|uniref:DUF6993 domain-containing protein n=1 Tax=Arthrobacter sp. H41 TaxID=1312978 RepID=UPI000675F3DE|nr:hypothetical protein [Arthrobacter sp. H41]